MATKHPFGSTEPSTSTGGRPPALKLEHIAVLHDIVMERAQASLQEIADEPHHRCALRALGVVRLKPVRRTRARCELREPSVWLHGSPQA